MNDRLHRFVLVAVLAVWPAVVRAEVLLERVISREAPAFAVRQARMAVGRDGLVYLTAGGKEGYILRVGRDGTDRFGGAAPYALSNATANAAGVPASANAHFAHKMIVYNRQLRPQAEDADFLVNDQVGWDAPGHIEAGATDFYVLDQHRDRIVRLDASARVLRAYPYTRIPANGLVHDFRVCEQTECFVLFSDRGPARCVGFDGTPRWTADVPAHPSSPWEVGGGFDLDSQGVLHAIAARGDALLRFSADGKPLPPVPLQLGERKPTGEEPGFTDLRIWDGQVLLHRRHDTELFQVYDLKTGAFRHAEHSMHELLRVRYPSATWTAGAAVPFRITLTANGKDVTPRWFVWACPPGTIAYRQFPIEEGMLQVPADAAGLYQIKVTPELRPWMQGETAEHRVDAWVEIRRPGCQGTATVLTPGNRDTFGRGEELPFSVVVRTTAAQPVDFTVRLVEGGRTVAEGHGTAPPAARTQTFLIPARVTSALRPGAYRLEVDAPGLTCSPWPIVLGSGMGKRGLDIIQYGDYGPTFPTEASVWDAADVSAAHVDRMHRLGFNLFIDRLGVGLESMHLAPDRLRPAWAAAGKRLAADLDGAPPERLDVAPPLLQTLARAGSRGQEQMAILVNNDGGLPLGTPSPDSRSPEQYLADLTKVTNSLKPYPGFRGWSWASNWWVSDGPDGKGIRSPAEGAAHAAALKKARETGEWDPLLDAVADRRLAFAADAERLFNRRLAELAPGKVTAAACPYRNAVAYPPTTLANVAEADLQAQWEQLPVPYYLPHNVDFYKRPGKRGWVHPEIWNDAGTGDQVIPSTFDALMRGADGVGLSGRIPPWGDHPGDKGDDPRLAYFGTTSVFRATNGLVRPYGPWFTTLDPDDRVAIVVSGRLMRIDTWTNVTGTCFARLLEAYATCLHAHHPARFVFAEDLEEGTLTRFKAVLVVGQTVDFEPRLAAALRAAQAGGVAVFHDGSCRARVVAGFTPLGVSFTKFEADPHMASDDSAFWRFRDYCLANLPAVKEKLDGVVEPAARLDVPEVFVSARRAEEGRYLFVVNNTTTTLDPGQLWRMTLSVATRVPLEVPVAFGNANGVVYDVFAGRRAEPEKGRFRADLRDLPARVFAVLPAAIAGVEVRGPAGVRAGERFAWTATVLDGDHKAIRASIPVRVRLLASNGAVLDEQFTAAGSSGAIGEWTTPVNPGGALTLEAVELITGLSARLLIEVQAGEPVTLQQRPETLAARPPVPAKASRQSADRSGLAAPDSHFGPHVRDLIVTDGVAVLNTMNWDHNLYGLDVGTGAVSWRRRAGHYFAFAPQAIDHGFAVQGFRFDSASGYGLYLGTPDGKLARRFDLFGVPGRLPHRFVPGILRDRNNQFAVAPDGSWVASAGDLGRAVWSREGQLLWSRETWQTSREAPLLLALDKHTLIVVSGLTVAAVDPATGKETWSTTLARTGEVRKLTTAANGTLAVLSTTDGGRLFVLRGGKFLATLPAAGDDVALSPDGALATVVGLNHLKLYSVRDGLRWQLPADDTLHSPRFDATGRRVAVASEMGTVYVVDTAGRILLERDNGALSVPAWLPGGDLILANWMGSVCRLDADYAERWRTLLRPSAIDMRSELLAEDGAPVTRVAHWGNADPRPAPLTPNLLGGEGTLVRFVGDNQNIQFVRDPAPLTDGKPTAPPAPWLAWGSISDFAETSPHNTIVFDTGRNFVRVTGITLVEDEAHPESWLRDAGFEVWDAGTERWKPVQPLLSDAAVHTHHFAMPVEGSRFRLTLPWGLCGNLRLEQIVLHGERVGPTHPDARARRPVAVLFDEADDLRSSLINDALGYSFEGAWSGGRCLALKGDRSVGPSYQPRFGGHAVPHWDFPIAENPEPGEYRYLQFAWKAEGPKTRGISFQLGTNQYGQMLDVYAGEHKLPDGAIAMPWKADVPQGWQVVRVDLWKVYKKPVRIRQMGFAATGGGAYFDQVLLGRTEKDLDAVGR